MGNLGPRTVRPCGVGDDCNLKWLVPRPAPLAANASTQASPGRIGLNLRNISQYMAPRQERAYANLLPGSTMPRLSMTKLRCPREVPFAPSTCLTKGVFGSCAPGGPEGNNTLQGQQISESGAHRLNTEVLACPGKHMFGDISKCRLQGARSMNTRHLASVALFADERRVDHR